MASGEPKMDPEYFAADGSEAPEAVEIRLTIGDGFRFGCGLILAFLILLLAVLIFFTILGLLAALLNLRLPFLPG